MVINANTDVDRDQSEASTVSVRDRVHEFDVLFQPTPFYHLQRPSLSPWRASPDVAASPTGSARVATTTTQLPVKAAVTRYDGDMFRRQTPTQVSLSSVRVSVIFSQKCCSIASVSFRLHPAGRRFQLPPSPRSSSSSQLVIRRTWLSTVGDRAFPVAESRLWNSLPPEVTSPPTQTVFRNRLKTLFPIISFLTVFGLVLYTVYSSGLAVLYLSHFK